MNSKKARRLRQIVGCDLSSGSEDKAHGVSDMEPRTVAQIQPDGNHTFREEKRKEARTTEERYLYRQLKKVYSNKKFDPEVRKTLVRDLLKTTAELTAKTNGGYDE
jgi:hypothetical protein